MVSKAIIIPCPACDFHIKIVAISYEPLDYDKHATYNINCDKCMDICNYELSNLYNEGYTKNYAVNPTSAPVRCDEDTNTRRVT